MLNRRIAIVIGCLTCWVAALSTLVVNIPGDQSENLIYLVTVALTTIWRTQPGPNARRISQIAYQQGVHDTLRRLGGPNVPKPSQKQEIATLIPFPTRRSRRALAGSALLSVIVVALLFIVTSAWPTSRPSQVAAAPRQPCDDNLASGRVDQPDPSPQTAFVTSLSPAPHRIKSPRAKRHTANTNSGRPAEPVQMTAALRTATPAPQLATHVEATITPRPDPILSLVPIAEDQ